MTDNEILRAAVEICERREKATPQAWQMWRRLAGSLRKALSLL